MKIIISHDVDHISFREHWHRDLFVPKWLAKNCLYAGTGKVKPALALRRLAAIGTARLHRVEELMEVDSLAGIRSTFFVGVSRGLALSYTFAAAAEMVQRIRAGGLPVGVHGIAYRDGGAIQAEYDRFRRLLGDGPSFGVRNLYLRFGPETLVLQAQSGYLFDSSEYGLKAPYAAEGIVEFPVCLMDARLLALSRNDPDDVRRRTIAALDEGRRLGLPYFTIIFHDCYFSHLFPDHHDWYSWLIKYLPDHHEVTDFAAAVRDLRSSWGAATPVSQTPAPRTRCWERRAESRVGAGECR